eukprot:Nk52_evm34s1967 gene=Nk52_evmTU34s1967
MTYSPERADRNLSPPRNISPKAYKTGPPPGGRVGSERYHPYSARSRGGGRYEDDRRGPSSHHESHRAAEEHPRHDQRERYEYERHGGGEYRGRGYGSERVDARAHIDSRGSRNRFERGGYGDYRGPAPRFSHGEDRFHGRREFRERRGGGPRRNFRDRRDRMSEADKKASTTLFVGNLPYEFKEVDLDELFSTCGKVDAITLRVDERTGLNKGFAFVNFVEKRDAEEAFERYSDFSVSGRRLRLDWDLGLDKKRPAPKPERGEWRKSRSPSPRRTEDFTPNSESPRKEFVKERSPFRGSPLREPRFERRRSLSPRGGRDDVQRKDHW